MYSLRTSILHYSWLLAFTVFALLVQIQQSIACDMMIDVSVPPVEHCYKHDAGRDPAEKTSRPCCDFSAGFTMQNGNCHDAYETVNNPYSGKFNPEVQLLVVTVNIQEVYPLYYQSAVQHTREDNHSGPGTETYLSTQRLRI